MPYSLEQWRDAWNGRCGLSSKEAQLASKRRNGCDRKAMYPKEHGLTDVNDTTANSTKDAPESVNEALADWLGDIVTLESHIEEAMDRQLTLKPASQEIAAAFRRFHDTVRASKYRAQDFQKEMGEPGGNSVVKTAGELLGKAAGLVDKVRKDSVTKSLRDDYVAYNLAAISYTLLHSTALALANHKAAAFAEQGLKTYAGLVQDINELIPQAVVEDLIKNDKVPVANSDIVGTARETIKTAWKSTSN